MTLQASCEQRRRTVGFTLTELLVVIGIIVVAMGFMMPALTESLRNRKINDVGNLLVAKCNEARSNAVSQKRPWAVIFVEGGVQLYRGPKGNEPGSFEGGIEELEPGADLQEVRPVLRFAARALEDYVDVNGERGNVPTYATLPEGDQSLVETSNIFIRFLPDGSADFSPFDDVPTSAWEEEQDADIILRQLSNSRIEGFVDVSPVVGRPNFKIVEIPDEEE